MEGAKKIEMIIVHIQTYLQIDSGNQSLDLSAISSSEPPIDNPEPPIYDPEPLIDYPEPLIDDPEHLIDEIEQHVDAHAGLEGLKDFTADYDCPHVWTHMLSICSLNSSTRECEMVMSGHK